jgi:hypothetical protein
METDSRHKEIGKDLDHYISQRKGGTLFSWFSKKDAAAQEPIAETSPAAAPDEVVSAQTSEAMPGETTEAAPKKGFFTKWFHGAEPEPVEQQPAEPAVDEDLREVARITLGFIKMADDEARSRIRSSPDFEKFKEILKRRQVIK